MSIEKNYKIQVCVVRRKVHNFTTKDNTYFRLLMVRKAQNAYLQCNK